ncbi:LysR substrate-binding domain-containing protein [Stutzerimonas degradans]|uniref:LysR family transcriptional regulator n=1 Tax=Stutzerimonas degradans TaxID=2968968 RepID=A0A8E2QHG0_9GAMM|nr:LysR substrate-binding domain-containing protein [Stutzerimonas degradans]MCQ4273763.1 LysR substrate-binding domain-containing protein [Stutzerimonas degradans]PNF77541.1 LysR family transcriptional regulator [Stutzerimonas degradans]QPT20909.1 LysR family transcriptional regulator [Stutzerimonas degradans]
MKTNLDEMLAFVSVVDSGSISAAAEQLEQTASGVSRALSRLEEKLAVTLLRRTTRRLELTEEGAAFLAQARRILASVEEAEEQMALRRQAPAGRLRVNTASPFMLHVIVPLIGDFRARFPLIELELYSDDRIVDLLERRIDLAIRIGPLPDSSLHARPLYHTLRRVLASPAYLARHGTPQRVEELADHSLIGFTEPDRLNDWPLRHALGESWRIAPALRASSGDTVRELALAGEGLACLSDFMTDRDRQRGALVEVLAAQRVDVRQPINAVYYRNSALASRIACFLDYLSEHLGADAAR